MFFNDKSLDLLKQFFKGISFISKNIRASQQRHGAELEFTAHEDFSQALALLADLHQQLSCWDARQSPVQQNQVRAAKVYSIEQRLSIIYLSSDTPAGLLFDQEAKTEKYSGLSIANQDIHCHA